MEPVYIVILAIAAMLTAALTLLKIFAMKRSNPGPKACPAHGQIETEIKMMKQKVDQRQSIKMCDDRHENVQKDLDRGHDQFKLVNDSLVEQGKLLARMDERINYLAVQNGFGKKG